MRHFQQILFILFLTFSQNTYSCINEYRTLLSGDVIFTEPRYGKVYSQKLDDEHLRLKSNELLASYKRSDSIEYYSDYGVALIYLGEYQKAKIIYEEIEILQPNLYTTASNLGTIYELIGQPKLALKWIKKSIKLNPKSHKGSEWIHIKILEFKVKGSNDYTRSILGLDFGKDELPNNLNKYDLNKLSEHIWHQLKERSNFVNPKNKIVGNIYFDLGNILAQTVDVQTALQSYEAAKEYGFESALMDQRILEFEKLAKKAIPNETVEKLKTFLKKHFSIIVSFGLLGLLGFVILLLFLPDWISRLKKVTKD